MADAMQRYRSELSAATRGRGAPASICPGSSVKQATVFLPER